MYFHVFKYKSLCEASRDPQSRAGAILKLMLCMKQTHSIEKSSVTGQRRARNQRGGSAVPDCGYKHHRLPQQSCSGPAVNLLWGAWETGLTRQVQILSLFYSESSQAAKNTQRSA